jgi:hypothetical protein
MQLAIADRGVRRGTEGESAAWLTSREHASERAKQIIVPARGADPRPSEIEPYQGAAFWNPPGTLVTAPTDREARPTTLLPIAMDALCRSRSRSALRWAHDWWRLDSDSSMQRGSGTVPGSRPGSTIAPTIFSRSIGHDRRGARRAVQSTPQPSLRSAARAMRASSRR